MKTSPRSFGFRGKELAAQNVSGRAREVDAPARRTRLNRRELVGAALDLDGECLVVRFVIAEREELAPAGGP